MDDQLDNILAEYKQGLVMVFTGNGKGKTTAALGQALRAIGHGAKVFMVQFMKGRTYGEVMAAQKYLPGLVIQQSGLDSFVMREKPAPVDVELARHGLKLAAEAVAGQEYSLVILDEINVALDFGLIPLDDVVQLIKSKPRAVDLILTGRYVPPAIVELADMVSEIVEIKHHYNAGIKAREGVEF